jgi:hypothetical protein
MTGSDSIPDLWTAAAPIALGAALFVAGKRKRCANSRPWFYLQSLSFRR